MNTYAESITIKPIYGWGWFTQDGKPIDVPEPFSMKVIETLGAETIIGKVEKLNDTYTNLWVTLHLRSQDSEDNKSYTAIFCEKQPVICDDGSIDESSDIQVTGFADYAE